MADRVLLATARTNALAERVAVGDTLHDLIHRYATAAIYRDGTKIKHLSAAIVRKIQAEYVPRANTSGVRNADDLLTRLKKRELKGRKRIARARAQAALRSSTRRNMANLKDGLDAAAIRFRADTIAELRRTRLGTETREAVMRKLAQADRDEEKSWKQYQREHRAAVRRENAALKRLAERPSDEDAQEVEDAQAEQKRALSRMRRRATFLARFETAVSREVIDAMRQQARAAQQARFIEQGYDDDARLTWVTVNGADTCPDCSPMHGVTRTRKQWEGKGPGSGWTVCGNSCMCHLLPEEYTIGNESLSEPLLKPRTPRDRRPSEPKAPIKLGGKNAEQAKRVKKRAKAKKT